MISITRYEKQYWAHCAQDMYAHGINWAGHLLSANASRREGEMISAEKFDECARIYRAWLTFGEFPSAVRES